jgi:hypothetical protein
MTIRLLEVSVEALEPTRWKWRVSDRSATEIACGYETSRETAQAKGDSALFALLCQPSRNGMSGHAS